MDEVPANITGLCQVPGCGERVLLIFAEMHIEDHKQKGEYPCPTS